MVAFPFDQREVNQNTQIDQSQAGIDVSRRKANQANFWIKSEVIMCNQLNMYNHHLKCCIV